MHSIAKNNETKAIETKTVEAVIKSAKVMIVDDEFSVRKAVRTLLLSMGVSDVHDAPDGAGGLAAISTLDPDVVLLDWQMVSMSGPAFVRQVRSPTFPYPKVPIVMLTDHGEHASVIEAMRLGVHEFLVKPVSGQALQERLASVLLNSRPYGPAPRESHKPDLQSLQRHAAPTLQGAGGPDVDGPASDVIVVE
jgi:two-component system chemotaxis response regulator CheY